jgi:hypothetical protein
MSKDSEPSPDAGGEKGNLSVNLTRIVSSSPSSFEPTLGFTSQFVSFAIQISGLKFVILGQAAGNSPL